MGWMAKKKITLNDIFPDWLTTNGIFTYLNVLNVPWRDSAQELNIDYHGGHSGDKRASPLVLKLLDSNNVLLDAYKSELANIAVTLFGDRWARMWEQMEIEYNPINNYDMKETETTSGTTSGTDAHSGTDTRTTSGTDTHSGTDTRTTSGSDAHTGTDTTTNTGTQGTQSSNTNTTDSTITSTDSVYAFNSTAWENNRKNTTSNDSTVTDSAQQTRTDNLTETLQHGETITTSGTDALQHGETITTSGTDALQHGETITTSGSHSETHTLTRSGNIGVTTTAQMLEQERVLWAWNFYRNVVYKDLDSILTIQVY